MSQVSVFAEAGRYLRAGFINDPKKATSTRMTLYGAIRRAVGIEVNYAPCSYYEWDDLARRLREAMDILDSLTTERSGRFASAMVWSTRSERSAGEVLELLDEADKQHPGLAGVAQPTRRRYLSAFKGEGGQLLRAAGSWSGAIAGGMGVSALATQTPFAAVAGSVFSANRAQNSDILAAIDAGLSDVARGVDDPGPIARKLVEIWASEELRGRPFWVLAARAFQDQEWIHCDDHEFVAQLRVPTANALMP